MSTGLHVWGGNLVLALSCLRFVIRLRLIVRATHAALYALIFLMPPSGILSWYFGVGWATSVHGSVTLPVLVLVLLNADAALWHHLVRKSDVLTRMLCSGGP